MPIIACYRKLLIPFQRERERGGVGGRGEEGRERENEQLKKKLKKITRVKESVVVNTILFFLLFFFNVLGQTDENKI